MSAATDRKPVQPETEFTGEDPVVLLVDVDGQEVFDQMWAEAEWTGEGPPQTETGVA